MYIGSNYQLSSSMITNNRYREWIKTYGSIPNKWHIEMSKIQTYSVYSSSKSSYFKSWKQQLFGFLYLKNKQSSCRLFFSGNDQLSPIMSSSHKNSYTDRPHWHLVELITEKVRSDRRLCQFYCHTFHNCRRAGFQHLEHIFTHSG